MASSDLTSSVPPGTTNTIIEESTAATAVKPKSMPELARSKSAFERRIKYRDAVLAESINIREVRRLAFEGVPEETGLRARYWKLLWNYLPLDRRAEDASLARSRQQYASFKSELIVDPQAASESDHPLSLGDDSKWRAFFKDGELVAEIEKDAKRTFPQLHFFNHVRAQGATLHYEALRRVLFLYAKLNPGIRYVQGMNELLAPIYHLFASAVGSADRAENKCATLDDAEADAFWCFTNLMAEVMNNFCKTLDSSEVGVHAEMRRVNALLKEKDIALWTCLDSKGLLPQFYSFRWITLLLSQEFELPEVLRIWDSLFADAHRFDYLRYFCCAMLTTIRNELFANDFAHNLKLLQKYPSIDPYLLHREAIALQSADYQAAPVPIITISDVVSDDMNEGAFVHDTTPATTTTSTTMHLVNSNSDSSTTTTTTTTTATVSSAAPRLAVAPLEKVRALFASPDKLKK